MHGLVLNLVRSQAVKTVKELWYRVPDVCPESAYRLKLDRERRIDMRYEREDLAEQAAQHYWSHHDGYEASWPAIITLHETEDSEAFAAIRVSADETILYRGNEMDRADVERINAAASRD